MAMATSVAPSSLSLSSAFFSTFRITPTRSKPISLHSSPKPLSVNCELATLPVLSFTGEKVGETYLDVKTASPETARAVVHRALTTDLQNKRRGTASTLTRGEVRGGGRKPYPQKKTGRARQGSTRTPLRPGGGVVFGPRPRDWSIKINRKEKQLAISTALASAVANMIVVEDFAEKFEQPKTSDFLEALNRWGLDPKKKTMFLMKEVPDNVKLSSRNIGTLKMLSPRTLNLYDILDAETLVLTPSMVEFLNERYAVEYEEDDEEFVEEDGGQGEGSGEISEATG